MMDIYKWIMIIAGLTIIFTLAGLPTGMSLLLEIAGVDISSNPQDFALSNFINTISLILAVAIVGGIIIGFLTKTSPLAFIIQPYVILLISFVTDITIITVYAFGTYDSWIGFTTLALLIPIGLGYAHSVLDWWSNK